MKILELDMLHGLAYELETEYDLKPFFSAVRSLYGNSTTKMLPFGDTILQNLAVLQPNKASSESLDTIIR